MSPLPPGSTLGVIGGGQLGQMFAEAARSLGYRVAVLSTEPGSPASRIADREVLASLEDLAAVRDFARTVDALTYEFEAFPVEALEAAAEVTTVRPPATALRVAQDRIQQRKVLPQLGIPVAPFAVLEQRSDLSGPIRALTFPLLLKRARSGFDGRGQSQAPAPAALEDAWAALDFAPVLAEQRIDFEAEFSVIVARSAEGQTVVYEPIRNVHIKGMLDTSVCPAGLPATADAEGRRIATLLAHHLNVVGVLCVEFFLAPGGHVLVNEFAARPHNSGHLTIEACETSQFEQQVRALAGLPLGPATLRSPAAMANLVGVPERAAAPGTLPGSAFPHWYGKAPRPARKVGHVTVVAPDPEAALTRALAARDALSS